jgi:hypothetical protein
LKKKYPSVSTLSKFADVNIRVEHDKLHLSWKTDEGVNGTATLPRSKAGEPSELNASRMTWEEFKRYGSETKLCRPIFRGQGGPWRLRTSFHRTGRANLAAFLQEDLLGLHRHLSARTRHVFNLEIPNENGAFLNLVQHHGYPTPLLDWTYSPYVAAFFAFRDRTNAESSEAGENEVVRILVFDQAQWREDFEQKMMVVLPALHLSVGEFIAIENERMIPQQAVSTVTNIDDIEDYIAEREHEAGKTYLSAVDLPVQDRRHVVRELRYMGITAGSMFPGFDGACAELRERNFDF